MRVTLGSCPSRSFYNRVKTVTTQNQLVGDFMVIAARAIGDVINELNLTIPVFGWCEGPSAISISTERAVTFGQFQIFDVESIPIYIRAVYEQLLFGDTDAAVFINSAQINRA